MKTATDVILQLQLVDVTAEEWMTQLEEVHVKLRTRKHDFAEYQLLQQRVMNKHILRLHTVQCRTAL